MTTGIKDYAQLHFIVLLWGFTAILGVLITIPSVEVVFYRTLMAAIALGLVLSWRKKNFRLGRSEILKIGATGLLIGTHWILFFAAARVSSISVTLAGMATCSIWTSFLEPMMIKRKVRWLEVVLGGFGIAGLYVIFQFEFDQALGLVMALAAAFLAALFTVINGRFSVRHNPFMITFYEMSGACLSIAAFFPFYAHYLAPDGMLHLVPNPMDWVYLAILSLVCTVYAYSISVELMQRMSAFVINLTVNMEPVYGIILAFFIFGEDEKMTPGFYAGTLIILASVLLYPVINWWYRRKALETDILR